MKKFSKLILEKKEEFPEKHPLVNQVDWDEVFKPLIEHIYSNSKENVPPPGEGLFSSRTKAALDELIDAITEDYAEYYANVIDDGSQESFFNAFDIPCDWDDLMSCLQPLMDRTDDVEDSPEWEGGYFYISFVNLKYKDLEEFTEDILDVFSKLKMFGADYKISLHTRGTSFHLTSRETSTLNKTKEGEIQKRIKDNLDTKTDWLDYLRKVEIYIYNKETVQAADLD
jgi:hypothetical protein